MLWALDPQLQLNEYHYSSWEETEGLPHYSINRIIQTTDGYLWLATYYGVVRFDGKNFTTYDRKNTPALKTNVIWCLESDPDGSLWVGTGAGLMRYNHGVWTAIEPPGAPPGPIRSLFRASNGDIWVGTTNRGAMIIRNGVFTEIGPKNERIRSLHMDGSGRMWIGTSHGLYSYANSSLQSYEVSNPSLSSSILALEENKGTVYIGTSEGLFTLERGDIRSVRRVASFGSQLIWSILADRNGQIWVGTLEDGLSRIRNGQREHFRNPRKASSRPIASIYEDREGNLWFGASGGGLGQFHDVTFRTLTRDEGLQGDLVQTVLGARDGTLWVGLNGAGLNHLAANGKVIRSYQTGDGLANDAIWCLHEDHAGNIWVGAYNGTITVIGKGGLRVLGRKEGIPEKAVLAIAEDHNGTIWAGTLGGGLIQIAGGKTRIYGIKEGLPANQVRVIHEDRNGRLLIGTEQGLSILQNGVFTNFTEKDGLAGDFVFSMYEDTDGTIWLGSFEGGMTRLRADRLTPLKGLPDSAVFGISEDGLGNIWISTSTGIQRIGKQLLHGFADGARNQMRASTFGISDGLLSRECNTGQPAVSKTTDGQIWFPTMKGLAVVNPRKITANPLAPPVLIENVSADGVALRQNSPLNIDAGTRALELDYTALSLVAPEKVQFRYKLEPFEKEWVQAGTRRSAQYANLPPGEYTFRVIASNDAGIWSDAGASTRLTIQPHFYQNAYFLLFLTAAVCALIWVGHSMRLRTLRMLNSELEQRVAERTKRLEASNQEMSELIENLSLARTQAESASRVRSEFVANVSHEIRTPLNGILGLVRLTLSTPLNEQQEEYLRLTAQSADSLLYVLNDVLDFSRIDAGHLSINSEPIAIGRTVEDAANLLRPRAMENRLRLICDLEPGLPATVLCDGVRLRQVLLNLIGNAVKFTPAGSVTICASVASETESEIELKFRISDTGIGMGEETKRIIFQPFRQADNSTTRKYGGTGLGLAISARLVEAMGGRIWVESTLGVGSTFHFTVRAGKVIASAFSSSPQADGNLLFGQEMWRTTPELPAGGNRLRILLAEDNLINQKVAVSLLTKMGCHVQVVENGLHALAKLEAESFDILLLDIQMPEMDGMSTIAELRRREQLRGGHLPTIALTAHAMEGDDSRCIAAGMDAYLPKPINPKLLAATIERLTKATLCNGGFNPPGSGSAI